MSRSDVFIAGLISVLLLVFSTASARAADTWNRLYPYANYPAPFSSSVHAWRQPGSNRIYTISNTEVGLWTIDLTDPLDRSWKRVFVSGASPSTRLLFGTVFDDRTNKLYLFGGSSGTTRFNDLWVLNMNGTPTWSQIVPAGSAPSARNVAAMIVDPGRDRLIVCGGSDRTNHYVNDTFSMNLSGAPAWSPVLTQGAPPDSTPSGGTGADQCLGVFRPVQDEMFFYSGRFRQKLWRLNFGATPAIWTTQTPAHFSTDGMANDMFLWNGVVWRDHGTALEQWNEASQDWTFYCEHSVAPAPGCVIDQNNGFVVLGTGGYVTSLLGSTVWTNDGYDFAGELAGELPDYRGRTILDDPVWGRQIAVGGTYFDLYDGQTHELNAIRLLDRNTVPNWSQIFPAASPPVLSIRACALDFHGHDIFVFGGRDTLGVSRNDLWRLNLNGTPNWTQISPAGTPPAPRSAMGLVFDENADRLIEFGGVSGPIANPGYTTDVWAMSLTGTPTWSAIATTGTPPNLQVGVGAQVAFDSLRNRLLVLTTTYYFSTGGFWQLDLSQAPAVWSSVPGSWPAPALAGQAMALDTYRDRVVVFGGTDGAGYFSNTASAFSLSGAGGWTTLSPDGPTPTGRTASATYDTANDRLLIYGASGFPPPDGLWSIGEELRSIDFDPTTGNHLGKLYVPGGVRDMDDYSGNGSAAKSGIQSGTSRVAIAAGSSGIVIADVSDVLHPRVERTIPVSQVVQPDRISVSGSLAVVVGQNSLDFYDLDYEVPLGTAPAGMRVVAASASASGVFAVGVIPSAIESFGAYDEVACHLALPGLPRDIAVEGETAVVAAQSYLLVLDVSNSYDIQLGNIIGIPGCIGVDIQGNLAAAACGASGIKLIDWTTGFIMGSADTPGFASDVSIDGSNVYVADGNSGVAIVDISSGSPQLIQQYDTPGSTTHVLASSLFAYAATGTPGLQILTGSGPVSAVLDPGLGSSDRPVVRVWPNPVRDVAHLAFTLPARGRVEALVFDVAGRRMRRLTDTILESGTREIVWDGRDEAGRAVASGVYFVRVAGPGLRETRRIVVAR